MSGPSTGKERSFQENMDGVHQKLYLLLGLLAVVVGGWILFNSGLIASPSPSPIVGGNSIPSSETITVQSPQQATQTLSDASRGVTTANDSIDKILDDLST